MHQEFTRRATVNLPPQRRDATFQPSTFNDAENTVDVVMSAGARVRRYDWWADTEYEEELAMDAGAIDLARAEAGTMQVLDNHNRYTGMDSVLGVVTRAWVEDGQLMGTLRLSTDPAKAGIVGDIKAGIIRSLSVGYQVARYEVTKAADRLDGGIDLWRATRWAPHEVSFVTVPADPAASTRSQPAHQPGAMPCEIFTRGDATQPKEPKMADKDNASPTPNDAAHQPTDVQRADPVADVAAEQTRSADITELCQRHGVAELAAGMIRAGSSVDQARAAVLDELARRDAAAGGHRNVRVETVRDEDQTRSQGMQEAILSRIDSRTQLTDNGRQYRGMSLVEMGREMLEGAGHSTRGLSRLEIATRMLQVRSGPGYMGTGDFSSLLANVAGRRLRSAYEQSNSTYQLWARRAPNAPDFKDISVVQLSGAPELLQTNEHGEFTYGTLKDGAEKYSVVTYGRIVALTRQAIVNDDLRGFDRLIQAFGNSAARLENRLVYAQLTSNPTMADSTTLFHVDHANYAASGAALALDKLGAGRAAMRLQKGLQGEVLNLAPRYLIVPAALEQTAYGLTSSAYVPAKTSDINEFRAGGRSAVEPIVEPILDANSATAWYLAADSAAIDTVEYCYLDGAEGPVIESETGFEVDGVSLKARLDFAAKVIDHRGLYKAMS